MQHTGPAPDKKFALPGIRPDTAPRMRVALRAGCAPPWAAALGDSSGGCVKVRFFLLALLPVHAQAGLCIHDEDLDPLIRRFAEGTTTRGNLQVWEGDNCDREVPPAAKLSNPQVEVYLRPGEDPRKRSKEEQILADQAARAIEVRGVGGKVELRLVDRSKLFVDPKNATATFIFRVKVSRLEESVAAASAADLDATAGSPCRSIIRLTSQLSKTPLQLTPDKYRVTSDPTPAELASVGALDLAGLLGPTHAAVFDWAPGTGGQSQPLTIVVDGPAGRQTTSTLITNKCAAPSVLPEKPQEGLSTRVRLGYPLLGLGVGYDQISPNFMWSASMNYDYDYSRDEADETEKPGPHMFSLSWRAGPVVGDIGLLADATLGAGLLDSGAALVFSPRFVVAPRGLPLQLGAGLFGVWDGGDRSETSGLAFGEWVLLW